MFLNMLPEELQPLIVERIANLENVQPDAIKELEAVMEKIPSQYYLRASQVGGIKAAAAIMNFTTGDTEQAIFKAVAKKDRNLMQAIQEAMFVFDNLIMSDDKSLQTLMRSVDTEDLVLALKGTMTS